MEKLLEFGVVHYCQLIMIKTFGSTNMFKLGVQDIKHNILKTVPSVDFL